MHGPVDCSAPGTSIAARVIVQGDSAPRVVRLKDLGLTPIDFVWATEGADGIPRDISARILRVAGASSATIDVSRAAGGMGDIIELATRLQRFLAGARPMDGADLMAPHATPARRTRPRRIRDAGESRGAGSARGAQCVDAGGDQLAPESPTR